MWVLIYAALTIVGELLRPKGEKPKPSSLGDFQFPTATEARSVPVVWGTCHVKGGNVVWYGDLKTKEIKVRSGLFSSTVVGYKYYLGVQMAICHGPITFVEMRIDGKKPNYTVTDHTTWCRIHLDDEEFFGDKKREGGVSGDIDLYYGNDTQTPNDYLATKIGQAMPAYKGVAYAVFRQCYLGNSNYIKPVSFVVKRIPSALSLGAGADISGDANPAEMLYEIITTTRWGCGLPSAQVDVPTFVAMGGTLATEAFGLSIMLDSLTDANNIIQEILKHVDGVIYSDPATGLITTALTREDYTPALLPVYDETCLASLELTRTSWSETKNTVKIKYIDRAADYSERVASQQDLANIQGRSGVVVSETYDYRGLSNATAANLAAARAIKCLSYPLATVRCKCNRKAWELRPGSVIKLTWTPHGISEAIYRVTRISYGNLINGQIEFDAVEDVFAITGDAYTPPGSPGWTDPAETLEELTEQQLFELPYHGMSSAARYVAVLAGRTGQQETGFEVWSDPAGGTAYTETNDCSSFMPYGYLSAGLVRDEHMVDAEFTISGAKDIESLSSITDAEQLAGKNLCLIGSEVLAWKTVANNGDGTYTFSTVWRGCLDTVPADHVAGTAVFFLSEGLELVRPDAYPADATINAKILPRSPSDELELGDVSQITITTESRAWLPYPPGKFQINSLYSPSTIVGDADLTWAHRNRSTQGAVLEVYNQAHAGTAAIEGTVTLEILVDNVVKETHTGLTVTDVSHTYTTADRVADDTDGLLAVTARLTPINGAYTGHSHTTTPFVMTGMGMTLGSYLGGIEG